MRCPACAASNPPENERCHRCGEALPSSPSDAAPEDVVEVSPALPALPEEAGPQRPRSPAPESARPGPEEHARTHGVWTLIPYKNPKALAAYYCGFFALIPVVGFILGPIAILLGMKGWQYANAEPQAKGAAHAMTGIILGVVAFSCWNPVVCFLLYFRFWYLP